MSGARFAADVGARALVFLADGVSLEHETFEIGGPDGHHLADVRRLGSGEAVVVADGRGLWRATEVTDADAGVLTLTAKGPVTPEPVLSPSVAIAFAPAKADHAATVVHQLVELGVDAILPIGTRRSVVRWEGLHAERARERLQRVAREAAMQSHRACIPTVARFGPLDNLAGNPGLLVADRVGCPANTLEAPRGGGWTVVVGPEGGLDRDELEMLGAVTFVSAGPFVLRSLTAPVAVAASLSPFRTA